jgi:hypothetical protein
MIRIGVSDQLAGRYPASRSASSGTPPTRFWTGGALDPRPGHPRPPPPLRTRPRPRGTDLAGQDLNSHGTRSFELLLGCQDAKRCDLTAVALDARPATPLPPASHHFHRDRQSQIDSLAAGKEPQAARARRVPQRASSGPSPPPCKQGRETFRGMAGGAGAE